MSSTNLSKFTNGQRIALNNDTTNEDYIGTVASKSSTYMRVSTKETWPTSNNTVVNLDSATTTTSTRYLLLNSNGGVTGLSHGDPGYVLIGPGVSISVDFPATFNSGFAPDAEIPGSAQLKIDVSATANNVTDTFLSNGVTPS